MKTFLLAKKNSYMGCQLFFRGVPPEGEGGTKKKFARIFFHRPPVFGPVVESGSCYVSFGEYLCTRVLCGPQINGALHKISSAFCSSRSDDEYFRYV